MTEIKYSKLQSTAREEQQFSRTREAHPYSFKKTTLLFLFISMHPLPAFTIIFADFNLSFLVISTTSEASVENSSAHLEGRRAWVTWVLVIGHSTWTKACDWARLVSVFYLLSPVAKKIDIEKEISATTRGQSRTAG